MQSLPMHSRTAARLGCSSAAHKAHSKLSWYSAGDRGDLVACMAHPRRVAKVSSQIQREISEMFIYDQVVQEAICPDRRGGNDKLSAVASVTHVYVSNDLQVVKAYVSVYSDEKGKEKAINNLKRIAPYVRSRIGQAVKLRLTPEIRFEYDDTLDELEKIQDAIGQEDFDRYIAEAEAEARGELPGSSSNSSGAGLGYEVDEDDEDEDDDAGFFDISEEAEASNNSAAAADAEAGPSSKKAGSKKVSWSKQDPETFFAVEDRGQDPDFGGTWYQSAGPFDDLFAGSGDSLVEQKQQMQPATGQQQQKGQTAGKKKRPQQPKTQSR